MSKVTLGIAGVSLVSALALGFTATADAQLLTHKDL